MLGGRAPKAESRFGNRLTDRLWHLSRCRSQSLCRFNDTCRTFGPRPCLNRAPRMHRRKVDSGVSNGVERALGKHSHRVSVADLTFGMGTEVNQVPTHFVHRTSHALSRKVKSIFRQHPTTEEGVPCEMFAIHIVLSPPLLCRAFFAPSPAEVGYRLLEVT